MVAKGEQASLALEKCTVSVYSFINSGFTHLFWVKCLVLNYVYVNFCDIYKVCLSAIHSSPVHYNEVESSLGLMVDPTTVQDVSRIFK